MPGPFHPIEVMSSEARSLARVKQLEERIAALERKGALSSERAMLRGLENAETGDLTGTHLLTADAAGTVPMQIAIPAGPARWIEVNAKSLVRTTAPSVWTRVDVQVELTPADADGLAFSIYLSAVHSAFNWQTAAIPGAPFRLAQSQEYTLALKASLQTAGSSFRYYKGGEYLQLDYKVVSLA